MFENRAFDASGDQIYETLEAHELAGDPIRAVMEIRHLPVDINGDGVPDPNHDGRLEDAMGTRDVHGAFDGRTGMRLVTAPTRRPLEALRALPGLELLDVRQAPGNVLVVSLLDSRTATTRWTTEVTLDAPVTDTAISGLPRPEVNATVGDLDGDHDHEIALAITVDATDSTRELRHVLLRSEDGTAHGSRLAL